MRRRKEDFDENWEKDETAVPIPIQTFLWRQSSPFIRPRLGKLHEATCMEIKEASKSLEKVLVQNILFGLSPSLTEAIKSVNRWRFVQAAFPHVVHCAATLLYNRRETTIATIGTTETKLLYTLHWLFLDAAEECSDSATEKGDIKPPFYYLFSITSMQVFIYLFAPLLHILRESDFRNFRLENGLKIWNAMWEFRHPDIPAFTTPVKPKRIILKGKRSKKSQNQFGDVFLGCGKAKSADDESLYSVGAGMDSSSRAFSKQSSVHDSPTSVLSQDSRSVDPAKLDEEQSLQNSDNGDSTSLIANQSFFQMRLIVGPREASFPETIPEETSSTEEEHVVIFRLGSQENDVFRESLVYQAEHPSLFLQPPSFEVRDASGFLQLQTPSQAPSTSSPSHSVRSIASGGRNSPLADPTLATIMDVAVIRCLFVHQWAEEAIFWALTFIYRRMQEISHEVSLKDEPRQRSNSLPVPKIKISHHCDAPEAKKETQDSSEQSSSEQNFSADQLIRSRDRLLGGSMTRKKKKISDLRAFVETKLWSRSEKTLEHIGREETIHDIHEKPAPSGRTWEEESRPHSAMDKFEEKKLREKDLSYLGLETTLSKGKSMPSLSVIDDAPLTSSYVEHNRKLGGTKLSDSAEDLEKKIKPLPLEGLSSKVKQPIITVTQVTPSPSEYGWRDQVGPSEVARDMAPRELAGTTMLASCVGNIPFLLSQTGSVESRSYQYFPVPSIAYPQVKPDSQKPGSKPPLARSYTDSEIQYPCPDTSEITGAGNYVTNEGYINLKVLLKAAQCISHRDSHACSVRVCELILNLVDFLLDMGILKFSAKATQAKAEAESDNTDKSTNEKAKTADLSEAESKHVNLIEIFMDTTMRVICHLGCPNGCNNGHKGSPADFLRHTAQSLLTRISRSNLDAFRKYLRSFVASSTLEEILNFFHSFLGFCVNPTSLLSPMSEWLAKLQDTKRPTTGRNPQDAQQGGYATNFGAGLGGAGSRGIEGQVVASVLKGMVTRFVKGHSWLKSQDNMTIYNDVRQLMCYVKEAHGGVFRRVALSGLIDSADRPHKKIPTTKTTRIVRTVAYSDTRDSPPDEEIYDTGKTKRGLFKKKITSASLISGVRKVPSSSSICDDIEESSHASPSSTIRRRNQSVYHSRRSNDFLLPGSMSRKKRINKLVKWLRKTRGRESPEISGLSGIIAAARLPPQDGGRARYPHGSQYYRPKYITKPGSGPLTQKLLQARKKVEDNISRLAFGKAKKKDSNSDDSSDGSRRNSDDLDSNFREASFVLLRDRKMVDMNAVKQGMLRFAFLLETCQPGSVPDPQLAGALLDLPAAPVVARAAFLLEMAHFVNKCNRGIWPAWMRNSISFYRPHQMGGMNARCSSVGARKMPALQRAAGKMFFGWAEAIGARLEDIYESIGPAQIDIELEVEIADVKTALRTRDEEEDFLDELNVNPGGGDCPIALRMIAVHLLFEITSFLRETYPILPKSGRTSIRGDKHGHWHGQATANLGVREPHSRRWSIVLGSGGVHSSAQSLHSIEGHMPLPHGSNERKISFAPADDTESLESSSNAATQHEEERVRRLSQGRTGFRKISTGSIKRRSLKLKKTHKDLDSDHMMRSDSIKSRRKVSAVSERSDTSDHPEHDISGDESPGVLSNEEIVESPAEQEIGDEIITGNFAWLNIVSKMSGLFNTSCTHQNFCHPFCYRRQMRACKRIVYAVKKVYGETCEFEEMTLSKSIDSALKKDDKKTVRKASETTHGSVDTRDSIGRKGRCDKSVDLSVHSRTGQESIVQVSKDNVGSTGIKSKEDKKKEDSQSILKFLRNQVEGLFSTPFSLIIKSIATVSEEIIIEILPMAWEMVLESDNELASTAAVVFILAGVKTPALATSIINGQLTHADPTIRMNAICRFQVIWRARYQAWARMEEAAHVTFKVPPHGIEFTLPSPKIGLESIAVGDPPWLPRAKLNVEEVTLDQIQQKRSYLTANRTRRKIHAEMVKTALETEEAKRRTERENFVLSAVPVTIQAAYEPSLHHVATEEHDEGEENEVDPVGRPVTTHHIYVAQNLFPSCLCASVLTMVHLLEDPAVTPDGIAVYEIAEKVVWSCLVEDSALFLRFFLEKLTREKHEIIAKLLRRLIRFIPRLPSQTAFALFNYLVGYVMFSMRSSQETGLEHTASALSILWTIVPSVHGILFKDLKQIFRKEQCDGSLLLTANIPSAKKIIVHGPEGEDAGIIPSQFALQEDTQFSQIHIEACDYFGIPEEEVKYYFLFDKKTSQIHNMHYYIRDFYQFNYIQHPEMCLLKMEPNEAFALLQKRAFIIKFLEIGKVLLMYSVLKKPDQVTQRVFFIHEELIKLPAFPRKALEVDFNVYKGGPMDKEIRGLDQLHKYMWVKLIARMFEGMVSNLGYAADLRIFICVINGALILHCEDSSMLRLCMATCINAAIQFNKNLFSTNGYMLIMPTILRVYSNYETNRMVCKVIEMVCKQFYILHRKPFILQMLGAVAPWLDTDDDAIYGDANKVRGSRLFDLLHSLEKNHDDSIHILELVDAELPLEALDFCYHDESDNLTLLEIIDMCVTVVAYAADSRRGHQMLAILEAILAKTLQHFQQKSKRDFRQEKETIYQVSIAIKTLIINAEPLAKNYNGPQLPGFGEGWGSNRAQATRASKNPNVDPEDDSHHLPDTRRQLASHTSDVDDPEALRKQFREPRAMLLNIVAEFYSIAAPRLVELSKKTEVRQIELLDNKCHMRLCDVAHSLLKMAPYDSLTMGSKGLQRFINEILPSPDWSQEELRPALVNILRRLEKMFNKIAKKSAVRRVTEWSAASNLLKGVYTTLAKHPYIAHLPHLKMLISICQSLVLGERLLDTEAMLTPLSTASGTNAPPQDFCSVVVRIIAMQILALGVSYSLEQICGGASFGANCEKSENMVVNLLLPMCLRVGCSPKDSPKMRRIDISFAVTVILHAMNPLLAKLSQNNPAPQSKASQPSSRSAQQARSNISSDPRSQSWSHYHDQKSLPKVKPVFLKIAFLGLKVLIVCFDKQLSQDWFRILDCIRNMESRGEGGVALWDFMDFVISYQCPLSLQMRPFIHRKLSKPLTNEIENQYKKIVRERFTGISVPTPVCKGILLRNLGHHLKILREELLSDKITKDTLRPPSLEIQSEISHFFRRNRPSVADRGQQSPAALKGETISGTMRPSAPSIQETSISEYAPVINKEKSYIDDKKVEDKEETRTSTPQESATPAMEHHPKLQRQTSQGRKTFKLKMSRKDKFQATVSKKDDVSKASFDENETIATDHDNNTENKRRSRFRMRSRSLHSSKTLEYSEFENEKYDAEKLKTTADTTIMSSIEERTSTAPISFEPFSILEPEKVSIIPKVTEVRESSFEISEKSSSENYKDKTVKPRSETAATAVSKVANIATESYESEIKLLPRQSTVSSVSYSSRKPLKELRRHSESVSGRPGVYRRIIERQSAIVEPELYKQPESSSGYSAESVRLAEFTPQKTLENLEKSLSHQMKSNESSHSDYYSQLSGKSRKIGVANFADFGEKVASWSETDKLYRSTPPTRQASVPFQPTIPRKKGTYTRQESVPETTEYAYSESRSLVRSNEGSVGTRIRSPTKYRKLSPIQAIDSQTQATSMYPSSGLTKRIKQTSPTECKIASPTELTYRITSSTESFQEPASPIEKKSFLERFNLKYFPESTSHQTSHIEREGSQTYSSRSQSSAISVSGKNLPQGTRRFVVDDFTVTFTEKNGEEDTLI